MSAFPLESRRLSNGVYLPVLTPFRHVGQELFLPVTPQAGREGLVQKPVAVRDPFQVEEDGLGFYGFFVLEKGLEAVQHKKLQKYG